MTERNLLSKETIPTQTDIPSSASLIPREQKILQILTSAKAFKFPALNTNLFKADLVMTLNLPDLQYIPRKEKPEIGSFLKNPHKHTINAYEAAFNELYADMEEKGDALPKKRTGELQLRFIDSVKPIFNQLSSNLLPSDKKTQQMDELKQEYQSAPKDGQEEQSKINKSNFCNKIVHFQNIQRGRIQNAVLKCTHQYTGKKDSFSIILNTLIYTLTQECGFEVSLFLISKRQSQKDKQLKTNFLGKIKHKLFEEEITKIYIFLRVKDQRLQREAHKFAIKKQIYYDKIDPYLNIPTDRKNRPIKYNEQIQKDNQKTQLSRAKTANRRMGLRIHDEQNSYIFEHHFLTPIEKQKFEHFLKDESQFLDKLLAEDQDGLTCYLNPDDPDAPTSHQLQYLYELNRRKMNPGVLKQFVKQKKQRRYISQVRKLTQKYGFPTYKPPNLYVEYFLCPKRLGYFPCLDLKLTFKEQIVGPRGELSLFLKMERIKICYMVLKEKVNINGLQKMQASLLALSDDYEKYGITGGKRSQEFHFYYRANQKERRNNPEIHGGLNGKNLCNDWKVILFWRTDFQTLRNYLGQTVTYQFFVKIYLMTFFAFLMPLAIGGQIMKKLVVEKIARKTGQITLQIVFGLGYLLLVTLTCAVAQVWYMHKEEQFFADFVQKDPKHEKRPEYQGPYYRNPIDDSPNDYLYRSFFDKTRQMLNNLFFLLLLGADVAFYYGIRAFLIAFTLAHPELKSTNLYILMPAYILCYSVFFLVNQILIFLLVTPLAKYLITMFQNMPTDTMYRNSLNLKMYLFVLGMELIAPIDLVFIQTYQKSQCSSSSCRIELENYIYARYLFILGLSIVRGIYTFVKYWARKTKFAVADFMIDNEDSITESQESQSKTKSASKTKLGQNLALEKKLSLFLNFVEDEQEKEISQESLLYDETVYVVQFCTFFLILPYSPIFSLLNLTFTYAIERQQILITRQRPIQKSAKIEEFGFRLRTLFLWLTVFNLLEMAFLEDWIVRLLSQDEQILTGIPRPTDIYVTKFLFAVGAIVVYEGIALAVRNFVKWNLPITTKRKQIKKNEYFQKKRFHTIQKTCAKPILSTIARIYYPKNDSKKQIDSE